MRNSCNFAGRLTSDPERREVTTSRGESTVAVYNIAVNTRKDAPATFIRCESWGRDAETILTHRKKGQVIEVIGELVIEQYEKDGERRTAVKLRVKNFEFPLTERAGSGQNEAPDDGGDEGEATPPPATTRKPRGKRTQAAQTEGFTGNDDDEQIPF